MSEWRDLPPPPDPDQPGWDPSPELVPTPVTGPDPVGVVAAGVGFLGIVFFGVLLGLIAALLGAVAGQRARESGRSMELPFLGLILGAVDGVVWIALHLLFDVPVPLG